MERVGVKSLDHCMPFVSALILQSLVLHFENVLLLNDGVNFFLLLTEVFVLEFKHVY